MGAADGEMVGTEGARVGDRDGSRVGREEDSDWMGIAVGRVGPSVDGGVGDDEGRNVGDEGPTVGRIVGDELGSIVGKLGASVGSSVGAEPNEYSFLSYEPMVTDPSEPIDGDDVMRSPVRYDHFSVPSEDTAYR